MSTSPPIVILPSGETAAIGAPRHSASDALLTFALCATLCFAILAFGAVEEWSLFALEILSAAIFVGWGVQQVLKGDLDLTANRIYWPMLGFAVVVGCQLALRLSAYTYETEVHAMRYVSYALLLFVASQVLRAPEEQRRFLRSMSIFGMVLAGFMLMQYFGGNGKIYWLRQPRFGGVPFGPYVNHNHYAGAMEMLAPMPLLMSLSKGYGYGQRLLFAFGGALMVTSLFIAGSLGGMLAFFVELVLLATLLSVRESAKKSLLAGAGFLIVLLPLLLWLGEDALSTRFRGAQSSTHDQVTGHREVILRDGLKMLRDRPWLGWGLGTFPIVYPKYRSFYTNLVVNQAHNDYLQLLDETGVIGFAMGLWFLAVLYRDGVRKSLDGSRAQLAALVGCTGIVVHSLTDFNLQIPANAALFFRALRDRNHAARAAMKAMKRIPNRNDTRGSTPSTMRRWWWRREIRFRRSWEKRPSSCILARASTTG